MFAVRPHTIWRLTDFLLKAAVDEEMEYISVLTAREAVEIVAPDLIPANQSLSGGYGAVPVRVVPLFRERFAAPILDTLSADDVSDEFRIGSSSCAELRTVLTGSLYVAESIQYSDRLTNPITDIGT